MAQRPDQDLAAGHAGDNGWNAVFWCNHDQPRVVSRLGDDGKYWKESTPNAGDLRSYAQKKTPQVYQGEELGMPNAHFDDIATPIVTLKARITIRSCSTKARCGKWRKYSVSVLRDNARTPMRWDDGANAGFTTGEPWINVPKINEANTIAEAEDPDSITAYYKKLIALRKRTSCHRGRYDLVPESDDSDLMIYERSDDNDKLYIVNNLTDKEKSVKIPEDFVNAEVLIGNYEDFKPEAEAALRPYEAVVLHKKN